MNKTQKGVALVETLLLILILIIIGFGGYYVWNSQNNSNKSLNSADEISKSSAPSSSQKYVTIDEWGVKALNNSNLKLHYLIKDNFATFWSDEANVATNGKCEDYMGAIQRFSSTDYIADGGGPTAEQDAKTNPNSYAHIGNNYFIFRHAQALCPDIDESNIKAVNLLSDTNNAVRDLASHLQAK